jgi:hypothetical protein
VPPDLWPGPRCCGVDVFRSLVFLRMGPCAHPCGYPQPLTLCALQYAFRFISSAMAFPALPFSLVEPDDPRCERTLALRTDSILRSAAWKCKRGAWVRLGAAACGGRPPEKAIGPSPLPGRWPSAPNGQTLASRMDSFGGRLSRRSPLRREPVRWGPHLSSGASLSQSPNIRRSGPRGASSRSRTH